MEDLGKIFKSFESRHRSEKRFEATKEKWRTNFKGEQFNHVRSLFWKIDKQNIYDEILKDIQVKTIQSLLSYLQKEKKRNLIETVLLKKLFNELWSS